MPAGVIVLHQLAQFRVARQTAAKALRLLESEGLVHRVPGLGYYVSERL